METGKEDREKEKIEKDNRHRSTTNTVKNTTLNTTNTVKNTTLNASDGEIDLLINCGLQDHQVDQNGLQQ